MGGYLGFVFEEGMVSIGGGGYLDLVFEEGMVDIGGIFRFGILGRNGRYR